MGIAGLGDLAFNDDAIVDGQHEMDEETDLSNVSDAEADQNDDDPQYILDDFVAASEIFPLGYLSCSLPPYDARGSIGRLTDWPKTTAAKWRSVSLKCQLHTQCSSPAKKRYDVTDETLLKWFFSGVYERDATIARKRELGRQHQAMWADLFAAASPLVATGAASSSSDAMPTAPRSPF